MNDHRHDDPETSVDAAASIQDKKTILQQRVIRYALTQPDGFTDRDLAVHFGDLGSTYRTRRKELWNMRVILWTGKTRIPRDRSKAHRVWIHHSFVERAHG